MPATTIDDIDTNDDNDFTADGIVRRLGKIARVQERLNARLVAIESGLNAPPDPVKPTILAAVDAVRVQVTTTTAQLDAIAIKAR